MPIKVYRTNRAARKRSSIVDRRGLWRTSAHKSLTGPKKRTSGRGSKGTITVRHRGGGAKHLWRHVDFGQDKQDVSARVERVEYDPNRSSFIALLLYEDGERRYVLAWDGISVGDAIVAKPDAPERRGNRLQLRHVTPGSTVFNVEMAAGRGGRLFRSAGSYGVVMDVQDAFAQLKMPSGEVRQIPVEAWATFGSVSNLDHRLERAGSAGRVRRRGRRPQVRGKVMNPNDHPHGGGEGNQPVGLKHPKTKWGKPAFGVKSRKRGKYSDRYIVQSRKKSGR